MAVPPGFSTSQTRLDRILKRQVDTWQSAIQKDLKMKERQLTAQGRREKSAGDVVKSKAARKMHRIECEMRVSNNLEKLRIEREQKLAQQAFRKWERQEAAAENAEVLNYLNAMSQQYDHDRRKRVAARQRELHAEAAQFLEAQRSKHHIPPASSSSARESRSALLAPLVGPGTGATL
mmetsp:Transcript_64365/g.106545  ORF Transcript_64365/g.106545 Transcript_64365/m.106545 type:complete len:178 (-) Transcript_64365:220-753(-)